MKKPQSILIAILAASFIHAEDAPRTILDSGNQAPFIEAGVSNYVERLDSYFYVTNNTLRLATETNILWQSSEAHDWGSFTPDGHSNPDPSILNINRPLAILPNRHHWECVGGAFYVLTADNASLTTTAGDATITWTFSDGTRAIWHSETLSIAGAHARAITVDPDTTYVEIDYDAGPDAPQLSILYANDLRGPWNNVDDAIFEQIDDNIRRARIPTNGADAAFYRGSMSEGSIAHVEHEPAQLFRGGVMSSSEDISPVIYNSTITITQGGHTYRIPAQRID